MKHIYLMEAGYLARLRSDRQEILALARTLDAEGRTKAREELFAGLKAAGRINLAPVAGKPSGPLYTVDAQGVAHIPIVGELTPIAETDVCGAYSASALTEYGYIVAATQAAVADESVVSLDYEVDSPGGYVSGVEDAAQAMASASKPTRAVIGSMAASAALWLSSQADQIIARSPASQIGSIGVLTEDYNPDRALAAEGIDHHVLVSSGAPDKRPDTNTPEGRAKIVEHLNGIESVFVQRVADGRGVTPAKVRKDFGQGGMLMAADALKVGLIDAVMGEKISRRDAAPQGKEKPGVAEAAGGPAKNEKGGSKMTLEQLKAEHPEVYQAAKAEGVPDGIKAERDRVSQISAFSGNGPAAAKAAAEAVASGASFTEAMPALVAASAKGQTAQENAPDVLTGLPANGSGAQGLKGFGGMTAKDVADLRAFGLTDDEIRANAPKEA